jgi:hypothetical protein
MSAVSRMIPVRAMNRAVMRGVAAGNIAAWRCVCPHAPQLQSRSGAVAGPTADTVTVCPRCRRVYFVIPHDKSHGPPVEVVELFEMPPG